MEASPFRLIRESTLVKVARSFNDIWCNWASAWGVEVQPQEALRAWDAPIPSHLFWQAYAHEKATLWLGWDIEPVPYLQRQMFGPERDYGRQGSPSASLAPALAERCWHALVSGLSKNWQASAQVSGGPPTDFFRVGSGVLIQPFHIGQMRLTCVLDANYVESFSGQRQKASLPALQQVYFKKILRPVPISLPVDIGQAEVGLTDLLTLGLGDVIRLDTTVDAPLTIRGRDGISLFHAYLGKQNGMVVLEAVRPGKQ